MQAASIIDCASQCLGTKGRECLAHEFDKYTKVCKLSDQLVQEKESRDYSSTKVYTGIVNSMFINTKLLSPSDVLQGRF